MMYQPLSKHPPEVEFYKTYFAVKPEACKSYFYTADPENETDIYVIAFNNLFFVEYQIKTLREFFLTQFNLIIVDNNNWLHAEESEKVFQLCVRERVTYLKAPDNYYQQEGRFDPSMKLGTTMNWLFVNCVRDRRPKYFGFLDHDCFLVRELDLRSCLDSKGMYGKVIQSKISDAWTLHVTPNFYRLDFVGDRLLDFRASHRYQLDTGGANYDVLYKDFVSSDYDIENKGVFFSDKDVNRKGSVQWYEVIDGVWYHVCASSHDQLAGDGLFKLAYTRGYLDARLQDSFR